MSVKEHVFCFPSLELLYLTGEKVYFKSVERYACHIGISSSMKQVKILLLENEIVFSRNSKYLVTLSCTYFSCYY